MKLKTITAKILRNDKFRQFINWLVNSSLAAILGCLFVIIFDDYKIILLSLSIILILGIALSFTVYFTDYNFNLIKILRKDQKKGNWREIIRIAYPLSRPLWLSRNYKLRIELGRLIDEACINLKASSENNIIVNDKTVSINAIRSSVLIDDLGWTLYKISSKNVDQAKDNIIKGISIAEEEGNFSKIIKGYRHISGMLSELGDSSNEVKIYQDKMLEIITSEDYLKATPSNEQLETKATLYYALARERIRAIKNENDITKRNQLLKEVNEYINCSVSYFKVHDPSRYAKTFCVRADIYMLEDNIDKLNLAKDLLKEGLIFCKDQQRRDNYIRISIMLLKVDLKRMSLRKFYKNELDLIKKETKKIYTNVMDEIVNSDDEDNYKNEIKKLMKDIKAKCKSNV